MDKGNRTGKRRRRVWPAAAAFLMIFLSAGCSSSSDASKDGFIQQIAQSYPELKDRAYETATVRRVIDGDTFETDGGAKVRLIGVNTPEVGARAEPYGEEASEFSRQRLSGRKVYMFADAGDKDRYGRLLRYVFIDNDPVMFNETLLAEGYANVMTVPPNVMFAEKFLALERQARENLKGLWKDESEAEDDGRTTGAAGREQSGPAPQPPAPCSDPKIKGNINSKKEKIYHLPGSPAYDRTIAEEMFCTEEEALAAGYRKAKNS